MLFITLALASPALAKDDVKGAEAVRRTTASGAYSDVASFFRMHGYVTLGFGHLGRELGTEPYTSPQILVAGLSPRTGRNAFGFKNDAALFIEAEPFDGIGTIIEFHFVGNALNPVLTEAKVTWDIVEPNGSPIGLRLVAGRYWWPFGAHDKEWFSAINRYGLISPAAAETVPAHFNEVGILAEGEVLLADSSGFNWVVSVGNGAPSFEVVDNVNNTPFDYNEDRTLTTRLGYVHAREIEVRAGFSFSTGRLRSGFSGDYDPSDARSWPATFTAFGPDLTLGWDRLRLRSYLYLSTEKLDGAAVSELGRLGFTVEPAYTYPMDFRYLEAVTLHGRVSYASEETLVDGELHRLQYGGGIEAQVTRSFRVRASYLVQVEQKDLPDFDNDAFSVSVSGEF